MHRELTALLRSRGAAMVGFADLRGIPEVQREGLPFGVSIAVALDKEIIRGIAGGPTNSYQAEYRRANALLDELSPAAAEFLTGRGFRAVAQKATMGPNIDRETLATPLPHKTVATRAGMGWIGKTGLLITEPYGSAVRLTSVLTDAPLPAGRPIDESRCGPCHECVKACPAHAAGGVLWRAGMPRAEIVDAFACRRKAVELASRIGGTESICGVCVSVCRWTRRYLDG